DHLAEIDQHPFAGTLAFHAQDAGADRLEPFLDVARERARLARGLRARHDDVVEQRVHLAHVQYDDVLCLDVLEGFDRGLANGVGVHRFTSSVKTVLLDIRAYRIRQQVAQASPARAEGADLRRGDVQPG